MIPRGLLLGLLIAFSAQNIKFGSCKPILGGYAERQDATDEVKEILGKVQSEVEEQEGKTFDKFEALTYSVQVVNGFNYIIKAETDDGYMHVQVYQKSADVDPSLESYETGKTLEDSLVPPKRKPMPAPFYPGPCDCEKPPKGPMVGAFGEPKEADDHVKEVLEKVREDLEGKEGKTFETFEAITFASQTVAGTNYLIKVQYDDGYLHALVFEPLPHSTEDPELKTYVTGKTLEDKLLPPPPPPRSNPGGFGEPKEADDHVKEVLEEVRVKVEKQEGKTFETFEATSYATQTVAGTNYLIKVQYDDGYLHALVFEPLPHTKEEIELKSYETGKALEDELLPPSTGPEVVGGFGDVKDADDEVKDLLSSLEAKIKKSLKKESEKFEAISYTKQIVSGTNYIIKVETDDDYLHVTIYKPPPLSKMATIVKNVETGKTLEDELVASPPVFAGPPGHAGQPGHRGPPGPGGPPMLGGPPGHRGPPGNCKCPRAMAGAFDEPREADDEIRAVLKQIQDDLEVQEGKKYETFQAVSYISQVVAGTNFVIKVQTDDGYLHAHVFRPLPHVSDKAELKFYETGKTLDDILQPLAPPPPPLMTGSFTEPRDADEEIQAVLKQIQDDLEVQEGKKYETFEAVTYISQVVAGTNFIIKVQTDDGYLHAHVFRPLPHVSEKAELKNYETGKMLEDVLEPLPPPSPILTGGYGEVMEADEKVAEVLELIQDDLEEKEGKEFTKFEAVSYATQVVAGTNYMIKVETDDGYLHAVVFEPLPSSEGESEAVPQLQYYKTGLSLEDPLNVWED